MLFEVIPNEQTPRVDDIEDIELFYIQNIDKLVAFKAYAETLTNAAGLAANQCSVDGERFMLRVFALKDLQRKTWRLIINPVITQYVGIKDIRAEGCLTWKGRVIIAERSRGVRVNYYDEEGHPMSIFAEGFEAQVWQHEINHLNGVPEQIEYYGYAIPKPIEVGRNEKCPCGSGLKYKHCCLLLI